MTTQAKIVTVWLDETNNAGEPQWVVDTDVKGGGESSTVKTFDGREEAVAFAEGYAAKKGLPLEVRD